MFHWVYSTTEKGKWSYFVLVLSSLDFLLSWSFSLQKVHCNVLYIVFLYWYISLFLKVYSLLDLVVILLILTSPFHYLAKSFFSAWQGISLMITVLQIARLPNIKVMKLLVWCARAHTHIYIYKKKMTYLYALSLLITQATHSCLTSHTYTHTRAHTHTHTHTHIYMYIYIYKKNDKSLVFMFWIFW